MYLTYIALLFATSVIASLPNTLCAGSNSFDYKVCSDGITDVTAVCDSFVTSLDLRGCPRGLGSCGGTNGHLVWRWSSSISGLRCSPATVDAAWTEATGNKYGASNCGSGLMTRDLGVRSVTSIIASPPNTLCVSNKDLDHRITFDGYNDTPGICNKFVTALERRGCPRELGRCGGADKHFVWTWSSAKSGKRCSPATVNTAWAEATNNKYGASNCGSELTTRDVSNDQKVDTVELTPRQSVNLATTPKDQSTDMEKITCISDDSVYPLYTLRADNIQDIPSTCKKLQESMVRQGCSHTRDECGGTGTHLVWRWRTARPPSPYCRGNRLDIAWKEATGNKYGESHCGSPRAVVRRDHIEREVDALAPVAAPSVKDIADSSAFQSTHCIFTNLNLTEGATPESSIGYPSYYAITATSVEDVPGTCQKLLAAMKRQGCNDRSANGIPERCYLIAREALMWIWDPVRSRAMPSPGFPASPFCGADKLNKAWAEVTKNQYGPSQCEAPPKVKRAEAQQSLDGSSAPDAQSIEEAAYSTNDHVVTRPAPDATCQASDQFSRYVINADGVQDIPGTCKALGEAMNRQGCRHPWSEGVDRCGGTRGHISWTWYARYTGSPYCGADKINKAWSEVTQDKYGKSKCLAGPK